ALFAVLVTAQGVQSAKARRQRRLFFRELHGDLAGEEVLARDAQPLEQLEQQEAGEEVLEREGGCQGVGCHGWIQLKMLYGVCIQAPMTTSHTRVTGMKIFQPRRMIWS